MKMHKKTLLFYIIVMSGVAVILLLAPSFQFVANVDNNGPNETFQDDVYFHPLLKAYKFHYNETNIPEMRFRTGLHPTFLLIASDSISNKFWQQQLLHISRNQCPLPCSFTGNKSRANNVDAIVFYLRHFKDKKSMIEGLPKRDPSQPWIMLSFEAALKANDHKANYTVFNSVFNRTMMHRKDADIFTPHGFIVKEEDVHFLPRGWVLPTVDDKFLENRIFNETNLAVSFISNCEADSGRLEYINEMQRHGQVDVYGKCGSMKCGSSHYVGHAYNVHTDICFRKAASNYMFYLAFENSICKDYVSEKLYNLLYYPIVPVVLGGANYSDILPPNSYINAADYTPKELAAYLVFLQNNPELYLKYLEWRRLYKPSTVGGIRSLCQLCVKLYESSFYKHKVYEDFYRWFYLDANCIRKWINSTAGIVHL